MRKSRSNLTAIICLFLINASLAVNSVRAEKIDCTKLLKPFDNQALTSNYRIPPVKGSEISDPGEANISLDAQKTHGVPKLKEKYKLTGNGLAVGVWDGGAVFDRHREFGGRVTIADPASYYGEHATHVAGTIAAQGIDKQAEGMAKLARIKSFDWVNDGVELCEAAQVHPGVPAISVSNHSYGIMTGWEWVGENQCRWRWMGDLEIGVDDRFGKYTDLAREFDTVLYNNEFLSAFSAAGNDGNDDPRSDNNWDGKYCVDNDIKEAGPGYTKAPLGDGADNGKQGYDTISGHSLAKNVITIGAVDDIVKSTAIISSDIKLTSFSSRGPADDGRIKPDLVANGYELLSPAIPKASIPLNQQNIPNNKYRRMSGTSMASPTASGIGILLNELALNEFKRTLKSYEMKAALIHTAIPITNDESPTYKAGWGLIDALAAGDVIASDGAQFVANSQTPFEETFDRIDEKPIRITIAWLDPPGKSLGSGVDIRDKALVHDLDLEIISPSQKKYFPWSLNPAKPDARATNLGKNSVDNVERIDIAASDSEKGQWTVRVKNPANSSKMPFALYFSGLKKR